VWAEKKRGEVMPRGTGNQDDTDSCQFVDSIQKEEEVPTIVKQILNTFIFCFLIAGSVLFLYVWYHLYVFFMWVFE